MIMSKATRQIPKNSRKGHIDWHKMDKINPHTHMMQQFKMEQIYINGILYYRYVLIGTNIMLTCADAGTISHSNSAE